MTDRDYMLRAIELAKRGEGFVNPNPLVGAVIVKDGKIIGEGYHAKYGELHAERNAIANLTESAEGATIYVTLEPCCHFGKQPPCVNALIENKIAKVFVGSRDPNPKVSGKGNKILRDAGIEVVEDFMREECDSLNPVFFHYITTNTPYVVIKYAMTADGKIATKTGASKWITSEKSRALVQDLRAKYFGIMAGIETVLKDDPLLTVRDEKKRSPVRIICDSRLRILMDCNIVKTAKSHKTIIAYVSGAEDKIKALENEGITLIKTPDKDGHVDIMYLMNKLGEMKIDSILVEGGGTLNDSVFASGIVNEAKVFIAPKIFGGKDAKSPVSGIGVSNVDEAFYMNLENIRKIDDDILLEYVKKEVE